MTVLQIKFYGRIYTLGYMVTIVLSSPFFKVTIVHRLVHIKLYFVFHILKNSQTVGQKPVKRFH